MVSSYLSGCVKLLGLTIILRGLFATPDLKQCGRKAIVIISNVGIKMCQLRCTETGQCLSYDYDVETLTCRLSRDDPSKVEKNEGYSTQSKNPSDVSTGSCVARNCSLGQRCLKSQSGKTVCVKDEKQIHYEESQQHNRDKLVTTHFTTPLYDACSKGELDRVKHIICQRLVEVNIRDNMYGRTPLMVAAKKGHREVVDFLVSVGANVTLVDNDGETILHWACRGGHVDMVKHLVSDYRIDVKRKEKQGKVPLMTAAYYGHRDVVDFLVSVGADVSQVDDDGDTILHCACRGGHVDMVKHLVSEYRVEVKRKAKQGKVPLMTAAYYGHRDVVDFLVSVGADVSQVDEDGDTILHCACRGGHVDMVKHLVSEYRVDVKRKAKKGKAPLMTAAFYGHRDVVDFLVSVGANVTQVDNDGEAILHWASRGGHVDMVKHLVSEYSVDVKRKSKTGETPLMTAAHFGHRDVFDVLVNEGANVSQMDDDRDNILHYAANGGHAKMIQYITSQNLVYINSRGKYGRTPLLTAAFYGHKKAFEIFVKKGGQTQLVDNKGRSILHLACLGGHVEMVKHILSQNMVDINAKDNLWNTAAMIAGRKGKLEVYHLLDSWG